MNWRKWERGLRCHVCHLLIRFWSGATAFVRRTSFGCRTIFYLACVRTFPSASPWSHPNRKKMKKKENLTIQPISKHSEFVGKLIQCWNFIKLPSRSVLGSSLAITIGWLHPAFLSCGWREWKLVGETMCGTHLWLDTVTFGCWIDNSKLFKHFATHLLGTNFSTFAQITLNISA